MPNYRMYQIDGLASCLYSPIEWLLSHISVLFHLSPHHSIACFTLLCVLPQCMSPVPLKSPYLFLQRDERDERNTCYIQFSMNESIWLIGPRASVY